MTTTARDAVQARPEPEGAAVSGVRVGVYGLGMIGRAHLRRLEEAVTGCTVTAVADPNPGFAAQVAAGLDGPALAADHAALAVRDDVDAILVAAGDDDHEEAVLSAIAAGKPVFCEKPLAPTADGCRRIVAAEVAAGRRLVQVGFMRRFDPGYRETKSVVDGRELGEPLLVHCAHRIPRQPDTFTPEQIISQVAVHEIDVARWLLDEEIETVHVDRVRPSSAAPAGMIDPLIVVLETRSGVRVGIETFCFAQYGYDIRCEIVAERGTVALPDPPRPQVRAASGSGYAIEQNWLSRFATAYDTEMREWIDSVRTGTATGPTAWDGYAAQAVCDAGAQALASEPGTRIAVSLDTRPDLYH